MSVVDQVSRAFGPRYAFKPHEVIPRIDDSAGHVGRFYTVIEERVRQEFGVELRMVRCSVEDEVPYAPNFVSEED